jgi:hypothetical protein
MVLVFWAFVRLLLTALVSFCLKNTALFPDPLCNLPARFALSFWFKIVKFLAIFFLTVFILASLVALPDEALEFLRVLSSSLSFYTAALMASESESLIFWQTLFSTMISN